MAQSPRESEINRLKCCLEQSIATISQFQWLIDSFVLDYYTESHYAQLNSSWRAFFDEFQNVDSLADLLLDQDTSKDHNPPSAVLPLSLLALRQCIRKLSASRTVFKDTVPIQKSPLKHLYKQVKDKKCHEIDRMAELCASTAKRCDTNYVVDFGAGLGHLARILSFQHGMRVCCLEQQEKFTNEAK